MGGKLVTIQALYRDCSHLKDKGQAAGVSCDTARSSAHDTARTRPRYDRLHAAIPCYPQSKAGRGVGMARAAQRTGASSTVSVIQRWGAATRQPEAAILLGSPATIRRWAGHDTACRAPLGMPVRAG